jgi:transposase InsO family protein
MAEHMRAALVVEALEMAVGRRKPETGLVHHSDQGSSTLGCASASAAARPASDPDGGAGLGARQRCL